METVLAVDLGGTRARVAVAAGVAERDRALSDLAESGDARLADGWAQVMQAIGLGAVALAHMFSPEVIVIGGGLGDASHALRAAVKTTVAAHGPRGLPEPIHVVHAQFGGDAGLQGAAAWQQAAGWLAAIG